MTESKFEIPEIIVGRATAAGEVGLKWLRDLPEIVSSLESEWNIKIGEVLTGGSHALVAKAFEKQREEYVLKIEVPDGDEESFKNSLSALKSAGGTGYVTVYNHCIKRRAWLLEPMGSTLKKSGLPPREQMVIICDALKKTWAMECKSGDLPIAEGSIPWFREYINSAYTELNYPCDKKVIGKAMEYIARLEKDTDPSTYVVVHGDAHNNNMLKCLDGEGYKFIDPDGMIFEKAYDLGVLMREWPEEFEESPLAAGKSRAEFLSSLTAVDKRDIWEWGFLQMVATALIELQINETELGLKMLKIAENWC